MPRRSVTVVERNHRELLKLRAMFMNSGIDLDYTTALNMALQMGIRKMQNFGELSEDEKGIIVGYLSDEKLKDDATWDEMEELMNRFMRQDYQKRLTQTSQGGDKPSN